MKPITGSAEHTSTAAREAVWSLLVDLPRLGRFSPEFTGGHWLGDADQTERGARFKGFNRWGPIRWSTPCAVVAFDPMSEIVFDAVHWSGACTRWTYRLHADGHCTKVAESF